MEKALRVLLGLAAVAVAIIAVAACGSSSSDSSSAKKGGAINIAGAGPDSYDPQLFQTVQAVQVVNPVYTGLVTYAHKEGKAGGEVIPGLAESVPKPTNGNKTYVFTLRKGLKYSDGSPVKANDFEHSVKRILTLNGVNSGFFNAIAGTDVYTKKGKKNADISGITADDKTGKITVNLTKPDGTFLFWMAEPYAAPMPASKAPFKADPNNPPPGAGPYKLKVLDGVRKYQLTKNKFWNVPGLPKGNVEKITGTKTAVPKMTQDVIRGKTDFMTEDPTGDLLPQVRTKYKDRFREDPNPPNTYYFFLNTKIPPFNKLEARQAVNFAMDSNALVRVFGGRLKPGCTMLPEAVQGHADNKCAYGDPNGPGDVAKAKALVKKSGTAGQKVTVWTNNKDPRPAIAAYYQGLLNKIGYKAKIATLDQTVYFDKVGTKSTKAQTGFTDWYQDFPHPADFFGQLLTTKATKTVPTSNQGFVTDPFIDKQVAKLQQEPDLSKVASDWGKLDDYVVNKKAYIVPYGSEKSTSFFSERMGFDNCAGVHPVWKNDWTSFCLK